MNIDVINFARHADLKELRWFVGNQLVQWIQEGLKADAEGVDTSDFLVQLAEACCVDRNTKVLEGTTRRTGR